MKNNDCKDDGPFDMTKDGTFAGLSDWALEVAATDPNSIQKTSLRPLAHDRILRSAMMKIGATAEQRRV